MDTVGMNWVAGVVVLPTAVALDLVLGDPIHLPHPIRLMGSAIERGEALIRRWIFDDVTGGTILAVGLIAITWAVAFVLTHLAHGWHPVAGMAVETVLIYYAVSIRSLKVAAMSVHAALTTDALDVARDRLGLIVGRDTNALKKRGIIRATVETVAENLVDGVVSPLFYAAIGGAPLAMAYKMVNTLDSMVGYKNNTYIRFGRFAARIDDAANYVPARLAILIIALGAQMLFKRGKVAFITALREGRQHPSPNAGLPEAAFAGALAKRLGGPNRYQGQWVPKPVIGSRFGEVKPVDIPKACRLMVLAAVIWLAVLTGLQALLMISP